MHIHNNEEAFVNYSVLKPDIKERLRFRWTIFPD